MHLSYNFDSPIINLGLFVMWIHEKCGSEAPIDPLMMDMIGGSAMEFLIVAAIAVINTQAVAANIAPLAIIIVGGMVWNFFLFFCEYL